MTEIEYSPIVAEIEALSSDIQYLREQNEQLKDRVQELERKTVFLTDDFYCQ